MDEPLSNLDAQLRLQMRVEIKRLQRELGATTLYVTHDQVEAMTMADMVAVMHDGRLQQLAPPAELYARPVNLFVARFCGSPPMNVLDGDDRRTASSATRQARCRSPGARPRGRCKLGFRPEHAQMVDARRRRARCAGEVYVVEPLGNETLIAVTRRRRAGQPARTGRRSSPPSASRCGVRPDRRPPAPVRRRHRSCDRHAPPRSPRPRPTQPNPNGGTGMTERA